MVSPNVPAIAQATPRIHYGKIPEEEMEQCEKECSARKKVHWLPKAQTDTHADVFQWKFLGNKQEEYQ